MFDKTSLKFILGFFAIIAVAFLISFAVGKIADNSADAGISKSSGW